MRYSNLFQRLTLAAVATGSIILSGSVRANNEFDALLADVNFGGAEQTVAESAVPDVPEVSSSSDQANTLTASQNEELALPMPAQDVSGATSGGTSEVAPTPVASVADLSCSSCDAPNACGSCGKNGCRLAQRFSETPCQAYVPPQIPTSSFYQYWRSNACNTRVWDGFRNRCHTTVDLSMHRKSCQPCAGGCSSGCGPICESNAALDCGPVPTEWCDAGCDGQ